jgi:cell division septal protein FtsQ
MIKKKLKQEKKTSRSFLLILGSVLATGIVVGFIWVFNVLSGIWHSQSKVTDPELDVVVTTGKMIHQDVIVYHFGLTNGVNTAAIPFAELRQSLLKKVPNILDVKIERRLPNRVTIEVIEREPIARVTTAKSKHLTGRVADCDGVVFRYFQGVDHLPIIRDYSQDPVEIGKKLSGPAIAALHLVTTLNEPEFSSLKAIEISTQKQDFLYITFADASHAKLAWEKMGENTRASRESLKMQLTRLMQAMSTGINSPSTIWIATDYGKPGRIYANNPAFAQ